ncbi:DMT family transporter [Klebsiella michiganensis]|uniref:DMT family transporter n=1 Tax=Klebsiella michiganensis TaxID=1134687 RepID=A0A6P1V6P0_9ENTR|nr:DMT family transporter [Klebsiella michiganensis]QHS50105.1 DMT family transporter [Klebsiella michiganensis]HDX8941024.1 DMT family transporter [Klebsiella michiganensis]
MKISGAAGALSVFIGAVSYGMPGVVLSMATKSGVRIESLIATQFLFSFVLFFMISEFKRDKAGVFHPRDKFIVLVTGVPVLCITYCFYKAVSYIGVPTSTLLMMQSAWIAPVLNAFIKKKKIKRWDIVGFVFIMVGVATSTGIFHGELDINYQGFLWGLAASISYSIVIVSSANVANGVRIIDKSKILTFGAFIASMFLFNKNIDISPISESSAWSVFNAVFASIIPLLLYGFGMPRTDSSLAGMLVTTELPAAFLFSYLFLSESITIDQIIGCVIIIITIIAPIVVSKCIPKSRSDVNSSN